MYIYVTDSIYEARLSLSSGSNIVMVDLETKGKEKRQLNRNTRISSHKLDNIPMLLNKICASKVLVRIDQIDHIDYHEIKEILSFGVCNIMLPMWKNIIELQSLKKFCDEENKKYNRKPIHIYPLIETWSAVEKILKVDEFEYTYSHFGLNDLSIELEIEKMFDVLEIKKFKLAIEILKKLGKNFGIGGLGLPSKIYEFSVDKIIKYHQKVGANGFIFTRDFNTMILEDEKKFCSEMSKLINLYKLNI